MWIVDVVGVGTLKRRSYATTSFHLRVLMHQSMCSGTQYTQQKKHITMCSWKLETPLISSSTTHNTHNTPNTTKPIHPQRLLGRCFYHHRFQHHQRPPLSSIHMQSYILYCFFLLLMPCNCSLGVIKSLNVHYGRGLVIIDKQGSV